MFKEGDIVRCIGNENPNQSKIIVGNIYKVEHVNDGFVDLGDFNYEFYDTINGFFIRRFKKVIAKDLTKEEIFELTKYKLGIKGDYYDKKEKRTERT